MRTLITGIFKTGVGVVANLLIGVISIKIMAVMLGPSGTGFFSLIRQAVITMSSVAAGGQTALVQGVASKEGIAQVNYVRSTFWLFIIGGSLSVILLELFAGNISLVIFGQTDASQILLVRWLALPIFLTFIYIYLKSVLNGYRAIGRLAIVEIIGPLTTLLFVYPACINVSQGYVLSFVWLISAAQILMIVACYRILKSNKWLPSLFAKNKILVEIEDFRYFINITKVTFLTAIISTGSIFAVRAIVANQGGLDQAGFFDLAWTLSGSYVMLILASFGTYYMPTLTQTVGNENRCKLIRQVLKLATLIMIPLIIFVISFKPLLITTLYSVEYITSLKQVRWMLIGDYLKITSWILAIPVIVNSDMKIYFWTEVAWCFGFVILSAISIFYFNSLEGIGVAFIILYLMLVIYYQRYVSKVYGLKLSGELILPWLIGFLFVIIASIHKWNETSVNWLPSVLWIFGSILMSILLLSKKDKKLIFNELISKYLKKN